MSPQSAHVSESIRNKFCISKRCVTCNAHSSTIKIAKCPAGGDSAFA